MSALDGFLALGTIDPVTRAFTEATFGGYARQAIAFALDVPLAGGAIDTGGDVLRNTGTIVFPVPTARDWPALNAAAIFQAATGGAPGVVLQLGARANAIHRGIVLTLRAGALVLRVIDDMLESALGGRVITAGPVSLVAGVVVIGATSWGSGSSGATTSPGGGANNTADLSDPNNAYLVAAMAA